MSRIRLVALAILLPTLAVVLAGCENPSVGPLAVQRDGNQLLVAICSSVDATELWFDEREPGWGAQWMTFWRADVDLQLQPRSVLSTDSDITPVGDAGERQLPLLEAGNLLHLRVSGEPRELAAQFTIGEGGLPENQWFHPDGT